MSESFILLEIAFVSTELCKLYPNKNINHQLSSISQLPLKPWCLGQIMTCAWDCAPLKAPCHNPPHFVVVPSPTIIWSPLLLLLHLDLDLMPLVLQVHIRISSYQCGGVLLNHWYIATAAHCVHRAKLSKITVSLLPQSLFSSSFYQPLPKVHLGEYDTKDGEEEPLDSQTYKVDHIVIHPDFRWALVREGMSGKRRSGNRRGWCTLKN